MAIDIRLKQTPFRVSLTKREHTELFVTLTNQSDEVQKASLAINTGHQLSLDTSGLRMFHEYRIAEFAPGATKSLYIDVYPKQSTVIGENPFQLVLTEYHGDWDLVRKRVVLDEAVLVQK
jgi:hypothetical protein